MIEDCLKLTTYLGERKRSHGRLVADALLDLFERNDIATTILLRGMAGFGRKHHLRTDSSLTLSEDLPAVAVAVGSRAAVEGVWAEATRLVGSGLATLERARLHSGVLGALELPEQLGGAVKLTVYLGRRQRAGREPAFLAVCDLLHRRGIAGASVLLGVDGATYGIRQRAGFFSRNAEVPVMIIAVGSSTLIGQVLPELGTLLHEPLITLERVQVCKRDGELFGTPQELPDTDERGTPRYQKLMVYTSESQLHDGRPLHREITRRLRGSDAAGVTTLRGVWGFHGNHEPHGDRLLQLGRRVPTVSIVIDSPQRIAASFAVIDELTDEHGLVTSELVPALHSAGYG